MRRTSRLGLKYPLRLPQKQMEISPSVLKKVHWCDSDGAQPSPPPPDDSQLIIDAPCLVQMSTLVVSVVCRNIHCLYCILENIGRTPATTTDDVRGSWRVLSHFLVALFWGVTWKQRLEVKKSYKYIPRHYFPTFHPPKSRSYFQISSLQRCCRTLGTKEAHGRLKTLSLWCDYYVCADAPAEQMKSLDDWICKSISRLCTHTQTHTHSKNTVLYNFWFRACCWQKWTQKSKQFSCSSIDSVCLFCWLQWKHSLLQVSITQIYKFPSMHLLCLFLVSSLSWRASVRQMCSTTKQAQTLTESNFISPTTTLIVCEVSKMFPKTHTWRLRLCSSPPPPPPPLTPSEWLCLPSQLTIE